ncbi:hypothetical protein P692DRAFT_20250109 [Suillus brevipes Sb2]|jgi:hypothetical protein|nr:hypothetical protein P692DRAFT_20250109 [Suillus brevipes Sb2]
MDFHLHTVRKEVRRRSSPLYNRLKALLVSFQVKPYTVLQPIWSLRTTMLSIDTQSGAITDTTKLSDILLYGWNRLVLSVQRYHNVCQCGRSRAYVAILPKSLYDSFMKNKTDWY